MTQIEAVKEDILLINLTEMTLSVNLTKKKD